MVELDEKLGGNVVQHREVQGRESKSFRKLFGGKLTYLQGGTASGLSQSQAKGTPKLYHIKGSQKTETLRINQVAVRRDSLNSGDVFILTSGDRGVWLWIGKEANPDERNMGIQVAKEYCKSGNVVLLEQGKNDSETNVPEFWNLLPGKVGAKIQAADDKDDKGQSFCPVLYQFGFGTMKKVAQAEWVTMESSKKKERRIPHSYLEPRHGYLLDTGLHVYIWLGSKCGPSVKAMAVPQAHVYFATQDRPLLPVTILKEKQETKFFEQYFYEGGPTSCSCIVL